MSHRSDEQLAAAWHDLMGNYHRLACVLDRELLAAHELSLSDFEVLQELHKVGADCTTRMNELGERVHLSQSALSRLISRLERDGLVERKMCTDDRRSVWTTITPAGEERYEAAQPTHRRILREQGKDCFSLSR